MWRERRENPKGRYEAIRGAERKRSIKAPREACQARRESLDSWHSLVSRACLDSLRVSLVWL